MVGGGGLAFFPHGLVPAWTRHPGGIAGQRVEPLEGIANQAVTVIDDRAERFGCRFASLRGVGLSSVGRRYRCGSRTVGDGVDESRQDDGVECSGDHDDWSGILSHLEQDRSDSGRHGELALLGSVMAEFFCIGPGPGE